MASQRTGKVWIRDWIRDNGSKYGIVDGDVGWKDGQITLRGQAFSKPDYLEDGKSYMDSSKLDSAMNDFMTRTGFGMPKTGVSAATPTYQPLPEYKSPYADAIQRLLDDFDSQGDFSYNPKNDEAYNVYKKQYEREGANATANTIGALSAATGGRPSSWVSSAVNQVGQEYANMVTDKIPVLMEQAYKKFNDKKSGILNQIQLMLGMDNTEYGRYADSRDFGRDMYEDERDFGRNVLENDRDFNRGVFEGDRKFYSDEEQRKLENKRYDEKTKYERAEDEEEDNLRDKGWENKLAQQKIDNANERSRIGLAAENNKLSRERFEYDKEKDGIMNEADSLYNDAYLYFKGMDPDKAIADLSKNKAYYEEQLGGGKVGAKAYLKLLTKLEAIAKAKKGDFSSLTPEQLAALATGE